MSAAGPFPSANSAVRSTVDTDEHCAPLTIV